MNDKILFSVLIPAYKGSYLKEAIQSVLEQDYDDFELIVLNDCSPEPLEKIVASFTDSRIRYNKNEKNSGAERLVETWNKCLSLANGDFVICMGDDDKLKPNCLSGYNALINKYPGYDVYHGMTEIINEDSVVTRLQEQRPIQESVYSMMYHRWNGRIQFIGDFLYRRNVLVSKGGFFDLPMAWGSDDITAYIMAGDKGIINSQTPLFQYRISSLTLTKSGNASVKLRAILTDEEWTQHFLQMRPNKDEDFMYWEKLKSMFKENYSAKRRAALFSDIQSRGIKRVFFWLSNIHKYGITFKQITESLRSVMISKINRQNKRKGAQNENL